MYTELSDIIKTFSPPPDLKISEFADNTRILSPEDSLEYGQWDTSRAEFQREIMDCVLDPAIEWMTVIGNNQFGKTQIINNILKYFICNDPCPIILMQPTKTIIEDYMRERLKPMIRDNLDLRQKIIENECTLDHVSFYGGQVTLVGSESSIELAARPKRIFIGDDVDRFSVYSGKEGDPVELLIRRLVTFWNRKILLFSTPTLSKTSRIWKYWLESDQRYYYIQCKHCGEYQVLYWFDKQKNRYGVKFDRTQNKKQLIPESVHYRCEKCEGKLYDNDINKAVKKGEWRKTRTEIKHHAGFSINELYSPWVTLRQTVENFLRMKNDPRQHQVWVNTAMAEVWDEKGESPDWERLFFRRENYPIGIIPEGGYLLVAGADVQKDRIEVEIIAYGKNKESWSIDYRIYSGTPDSGIPFLELDRLLQESFKFQNGGQTQIRMLVIDAGHATQQVYNWTRKYTVNRVMAIHGRSSFYQILSPVHYVDVTIGGVKYTKGARYSFVGIDVIKTELYNFLKLEKTDQGYPAGYCHFPNYEEEYFKQLTGEQLKLINKKYRYEQIRERNEALDCRVYGRAAAYACGLDRFTEKEWKLLKEQSEIIIKLDIQKEKIKKARTLSPGIKLD